MNNEVIKYISDAINANLGELEIKRNLLDAGWDPNIVEDSFAHFRANQRKPTTNKDEDLLIKQNTTPTETSVSMVSKTNVQTTALKELSTATGIPWYKKIILLPIILLILAGGFFAFYTFIYASPNKVWQKFTKQSPEKVFSNEFEFTYTDETNSEPVDEKTLPIKNLKLSLNGKAYNDVRNQETSQSSSEINYAFTNGNTTISTGLSYKLFDNKLYINVGDNPYLSSMLSQLDPDKKIEWLMLDLNKLKTKLNSENAKELNQINGVLNPELTADLKQLWQNTTLVKIDKFLGKEKINGIGTFHFSHSLDKQALTATLNALVDKLMGAVNKNGQKISLEQLQLVKTTLSEIVAKIEIQNFETWVGTKDFRLYKVKLQTNAPSIISIIDVAFKEVREKSRDAKRLADIRQMASALELYFNDKGKYPEGKEGSPVNLAPNYIGLVPTAPTPADGNCTDYFNTYWYEQKNKGQSYEYSFCIAEDVGGYKAGILKLTPSGITEVKECPTTPDKCYKTGSKIETSESETTVKQNTELQIKDMIDKIKFSASLNLSAEYSDYGVVKPITAPEGAFDLVDYIDNQPGL
jgi:hypothetical protein